MAQLSFEASTSLRLLRQALVGTPVGAVVTYADLSNALGRSVTGARALLHSARNSLLRSDHIVFACVRGVGLKRLNDAEIVANADSDVDGIRRKARKAVRKITSVQDFAKLDPKAQLAHTTKLSVFAAVAHMASDGGLKTVEAAASGRSSQLPIAQTLAAFAK